ncbi:MAG: shikimate kinase [Lachnospiraceae bacterium]|nr:shikimate kinase [Lachnospiraceae bacterium]
MGTGKSTVGRALATSQGRRLIDTDDMIISRDGRDIPTIFAQDGEAYFRGLEQQVMADIAAMDEPAVVSCGGGVVLRDDNIRTMKSSGTVIWLTAGENEIYRRVVSDTNRPLLAGKKTPEEIKSMMEGRREKYEKAADITIDTENKTAEEIERMIKEELL